MTSQFVRIQSQLNKSKQWKKKLRICADSAKKNCHNSCENKRIRENSVIKGIPVVGSGPILEPGKSLSNKYFTNVVLPTEYCPINKTIGFARKSASVSKGVINLSNLFKLLIILIFIVCVYVCVYKITLKVCQK